MPVVERVKEMYKLFPDKLIEVNTEAVTDSNRVSVKATISIEGYGVFTGHSQAVYGQGMMGDVALEVAETSAVGRALGFANIGLVEGIASADEMRKVKTGEFKDGDLPF